MNNGIQGIVTSISNRGKASITFNLKAGDEKTYKVTCPFFCPLQDHDVIFISDYIDQGNQSLLCKVQPFVTIPIDKDRIKEYFLKTLRGSGFGLVSAERLYTHLIETARNFRYGSDFISDSQLTEEVGSSRFQGDGVAGYLSDISVKYSKTYDQKIAELIASTQDFKINTGINITQAKKLLLDWYNKRSLRKLYLLGLTRGEILSSGVPFDTLYDICISNPYRIASIDLSKCDRILESIRRSVPEDSKLCGKVNRFVHSSIYSNGHTCIPELALRKQFPFYDRLRETIMNEYFVMVFKNRAYVKYTYRVETKLMEYLNQLIYQTADTIAKTPQVLGFNENMFECKTLTEEQKKAIDGALNSRVCIITGSAGTGKSTILREITRNLEIREKSFSICAFTGKAVSRLHEIMENSTATTIDRLILDVRKGLKKAPSHIIIDEGSMVTMDLFYRLLDVLEFKYVNITIVGDCNQLPPIGWGNLMREMMNCNRIPLFYLTINQRIVSQTSEDSKVEDKFDRFILENANNLIDPNRSTRRPMEFREGSGFYVLPGGVNTVQSVATALKNANYDSDDILILSPYKAYLDPLNQIMQSTFLDTSFKFEQNTGLFTRLWCVNDRVMMTKNNYDIQVMNGEEGKVTEITDEGIKVNFKDNIYLFKFDSNKQEEREDDPEDAKKDEEEELLSSDLIHSFAVSVHKSQGSEAKYVILYIPEDRNFGNFINVNLLYTAITRTRKTIWVVSSKEALGKISMTPLIHKGDALAERLRELRDNDREKILETLVKAPEFFTSLDSNVGITSVPDTFEDFDDDQFDDEFNDIMNNF